MPPLYIAIHILLAVACFLLALRTPQRWSALLGAAALAVIIGGYAIERRPEWAWGSMAWGLRDLVFYCNLSLEGVAVLMVLLWRGIRASGGRFANVRAMVLSLPLVGASLWSYSWMFAPLPDLHGEVDKTGFLEQTSDDSCSAAAAAMLLYKYHIPASEMEMAQLCVTRLGQGTPPSGLFRGLSIKGATKGLRPQLVMLKPNEFHKLGKPAIIAVGLQPGTPQKIAARMAEYGWRPGVRHAVAVLDGAKDGSWLDVADPTFGREKWPIGDMQYIWDDRAVVMVRK